MRAREAKGSAASRDGDESARTVREATLDTMRRLGLTTIFSNPGSTEIPFLVGLPEDIRFVLGLHEASVVGMATGWALGRGEPAFALVPEFYFGDDQPFVAATINIDLNRMLAKRNIVACFG